MGAFMRRTRLGLIDYFASGIAALIILWGVGGYLNAQISHWGWISPKQILTTILTDHQQWRATDLHYLGLVTDIDGGQAVSATKITDNFFLFGPYVPIIEGSYRLRTTGFSGAETGSQAVYFEIAAKGGTDILYSTIVNSGEFPLELVVELPSRSDIEFRFRALNDQIVTIQSIELDRENIYWLGVLRSLPGWIIQAAKDFPGVNPF